jgi:HK97 family phage prohead protease
MPGSFKKTLKQKGKFPTIWSHNIYEPIGVLTGEESSRGLEVDGDFNLDVQRAREIRSLARQGAVNGLSIGFNILKERLNKETGVREILEVDLWEVSLCVCPSNPLALVDEVRGLELRPFPNEHAAVLRAEEDFADGTWRRKSDGTIYGRVKIPATIDVVWAKLKGAAAEDDYPVPHGLRFPTKEWTAAEAKAWLADNEVKYISFEPAKRSILGAIEALTGILADKERFDALELLKLEGSVAALAERLAEAERLLRGAGGSGVADLEALDAYGAGFSGLRERLGLRK